MRTLATGGHCAASQLWECLTIAEGRTCLSINPRHLENETLEVAFDEYKAVFVWSAPSRAAAKSLASLLVLESSR